MTSAGAAAAPAAIDPSGSALSNLPLSARPAAAAASLHRLFAQQEARAHAYHAFNAGFSNLLASKDEGAYIDAAADATQAFR